MRPVLVADTSIIVDLSRGGILDAAFRTQFVVSVPDLLYERELAADYDGPRLRQLGLRVHGLDEGGVAGAQRLRTDDPRLSLVDAFALALAKRLDAILLTGDAALRRLAAQEDVECHGLLWLFDVFEREGTLSIASLAAALERVAAHPRCRLPRDEVRQRMGRYRRG